MTDLMKQFEVEMNWSLEQAKKDHKVGIFLHAYIEWLEAKLTGVLENKTVEKFQEIIRTQCDEISALKAQLRWRPVSEKPEKEQYFLANPSQADRDLIINACPRTYQFLGECSWEKFVQSRGIVRWFPVPPAPEGE